MSVCKGHKRHWFTARGEVGNQRPDCVRCGVINPRYKLTVEPLVKEPVG